MVANSLLWIAIPQRLGHIFAAEKWFAMFATHSPDVAEFFVFKNLNVTDIEICFRALYAVMLYRIKGVQDDHSQYINDVITLISPLIAMLSDFYLKNERGEVDIYREE